MTALQSHQKSKLLLSFFSATFITWFLPLRLLHPHKISAGAPAITTTFQAGRIEEKETQRAPISQNGSASS